MDKSVSDSRIVAEKDQSVTVPLPELQYRPELDGLRGVSILLVYVHHLYHPFLPGGFFGVDIFFVLSGFLITSLLVQEWNRKGSISLKNFYIRRALRLMPGVLLLVLLTGGFAFVFLSGKRAIQTYQGIWLTLSYASNWFYAFGSFSASNPLGITWSLAIEEQFYLTWPIMLYLALRLRLGRRWILCGLGVAIFIIALHRKMLAAQGANILRLYYASDTRADSILIGCILGLSVSWSLLPHDNKRVEIYMRSLAAGAVIFLAYMVGTASWADSMLYLNWGYTLIAVSAALILNVLILWPPKLALLILKFTPLVWIGRVSYGLYLWHWPVREFIYPKEKLPASVVQLLAVVVLSLLLTTLSYYLVEKRFLGWKKRFSYK
jgi:peptidoglycan/LPS O-acetylase OafA/YrhL